MLNYGTLLKTLTTLKEHAASIVAYCPQIVNDPTEVAYLDLIRTITTLEGLINDVCNVNSR